MIRSAKPGRRVVVLTGPHRGDEGTVVSVSDGRLMVNLDDHEIARWFKPAALKRAIGDDRISICRDEDCPRCGFPETYAECTPDGPKLFGCRKCGWSEAVPA